MQPQYTPKDDIDSKVRYIHNLHPTFDLTKIRHTLHQCNGNTTETIQKLIESEKKNIGAVDIGKNMYGSVTASQSKVNLTQLQNEMLKVSEKSAILEQKISHQEADIALLKDMIKARDLTIEKLQKELQDLRNVREREKASATVVNELAGSIKSNVDSGFRNVQEPTGVDFNKLIIEVKKNLAMSFLNDFKESRGKPISASTISHSTFSPMERLETLPTLPSMPHPLPSVPPSIPPIPSDIHLNSNNTTEHMPLPPPSSTQPTFKPFDVPSLMHGTGPLPFASYPYYSQPYSVPPIKYSNPPSTVYDPNQHYYPLDINNFNNNK
jgi:uncharacterized coiled-coil protein SlyX